MKFEGKKPKIILQQRLKLTSVLESLRIFFSVIKCVSTINKNSALRKNLEMTLSQLPGPQEILILLLICLNKSRTNNLC